MPRRKAHGTGKKHAIRNALGRLGWQAKERDVVAFLANLGVEVNEGLVSAVRMESVARPAEVKRHKHKLAGTDKRRKRVMSRKIPQRREYRR